MVLSSEERAASVGGVRWVVVRVALMRATALSGLKLFGMSARAAYSRWEKPSRVNPGVYDVVASIQKAEAARRTLQRRVAYSLKLRRAVRDASFFSSLVLPVL
jgi:hypothetical protein